MKKVILKNTDSKGKSLEATFLPEGGMNLISYQCNGIEVIDQSTWDQYEKRFAGLGALIGPHFHRRKDENVPINIDPNLFPHIKHVLAKGVKDPFSHGIARYVPWTYVNSETQIQAKLLGSNTYKGVPLSKFEDQDFEMTLDVRLLETGLFLKYAIRSEKPSVLGLHYYYRLPNKKGKVLAEVDGHYRDGDSWKPIPQKWYKKPHLVFDLKQEADFGFHPRLHQHDYRAILETDEYSLHIHYLSPSSEEISCQIYHPRDASFACIEPITALNPRVPKLSHSILEAKLEIF